jgi:hypothetical protein
MFTLQIFAATRSKPCSVAGLAGMWHAAALYRAIHTSLCKALQDGLLTPPATQVRGGGWDRLEDDRRATRNGAYSGCFDNCTYSSSQPRPSSSSCSCRCRNLDGCARRISRSRVPPRPGTHECCLPKLWCSPLDRRAGGVAVRVCTRV